MKAPTLPPYGLQVFLEPCSSSSTSALGQLSPPTELQCLNLYEQISASRVTMPLYSGQYNHEQNVVTKQ